MSVSRNRGQKRIRTRVTNGRFSRSTLANTFGLHALVCPHCRGINLRNAGEPVPTACRHCTKNVGQHEWV